MERGGGGITQSWQTPDVLERQSCLLAPVLSFWGRLTTSSLLILKCFCFFSELERSSLSFAYSDWEKCNYLSHSV